MNPIDASDHPRGVRRILMCDPADRNAFDAPFRAALHAAFTTALADPKVRAIVIGGGAKNFSVGGNLAQVASYEAGQSGHAVMTAAGELALLVGRSCKPLVAAVTGHCLGAGAGLALLCDSIVMGQSASIGFPFLKIGLAPDFGISHTLVRSIGPAAAKQALIQAKTFKAEDALRLGLADEVMEDGEVHGRALGLATTLAEMPAYALGLTKQMLQAPAGTLQDALAREALTQALCFGSPDTREGIAAFQEKRKADFVRAAE